LAHGLLLASLLRSVELLFVTTNDDWTFTFVDVTTCCNANPLFDATFD